MEERKREKGREKRRRYRKRKRERDRMKELALLKAKEEGGEGSKQHLENENGDNGVKNVEGSFNDNFKKSGSKKKGNVQSKQQKEGKLQKQIKKQRERKEGTRGKKSVPWQKKKDDRIEKRKEQKERENKNNDPNFNYKEGKEHVKKKQYVEAIASFTRGLQLKPSNPSSFLSERSFCHLQINDLEWALFDANDSIECAVNEKELNWGYLRRINVLERMNRLEEAIDDCEKGLEKTNLNDNRIQTALSRILKKIGKKNEVKSKVEPLPCLPLDCWGVITTFFVQSSQNYHELMLLERGMYNLLSNSWRFSSFFWFATSKKKKNEVLCLPKTPRLYVSKLRISRHSSSTSQRLMIDTVLRKVFPNLRALEVCKSFVCQPEDAPIYQLPNLKKLIICDLEYGVDSDFSDVNPSSLSLDSRNYSPTSLSSKCFAHMNNLEKLLISHSGIKVDVNDFKNLPKLKYLDLSHFNCSKGTIDDILKCVGKGLEKFCARRVDGLTTSSLLFLDNVVHLEVRECKEFPNGDSLEKMRKSVFEGRDLLERYSYIVLVEDKQHCGRGNDRYCPGYYVQSSENEKEFVPVKQTGTTKDVNN